jgi:hypothetical protein
MTMRNPHRRNPFDNPLLALPLHIFASIVFFGTAYLSLRMSTPWPVVAGGIVLGCMEGVWLYFLLRK